MGEFDHRFTGFGVAVRDQQAGGNETFGDLPGAGRQFAVPDASPRVGDALPRRHESREHRANAFMAVHGELVVQLLRVAGEGPGEPADRSVRVGANRAVDATLEQLVQRELQKREARRIGGHLADHRGDDAGVEVDMDPVGRQRDGRLEVGGHHRRYRKGVGRNQWPEAGVGQRPVVHVRP